MKFLEIHNLFKNFKGLMAIEDLSYQLDNGEIIGLVGPNGAGKTTLFNLITGFLTPTGGDIFLKGNSIRGLSPYKIVKKGISKTFQIPKPFYSLNCLENIVVSSLSNFEGTRQEKKRINEKAMSILCLVGLQEKWEMFPAALTQGDLKILEVAKALATNPELVLLDEPFAGLTLTEIDQIISIIQSLHQKNLSIIIIEHKLRELMKIVNRVIVLNFGVKIADGSPKEVTNNEEVIKAYLGSGRSSFAAA